VWGRSFIDRLGTPITRSSGIRLNCFQVDFLLECPASRLPPHAKNSGFVRLKNREQPVHVLGSLIRLLLKFDFVRTSPRLRPECVSGLQSRGLFFFAFRSISFFVGIPKMRCGPT